MHSKNCFCCCKKQQNTIRTKKNGWRASQPAAGIYRHTYAHFIKSLSSTAKANAEAKTKANANAKCNFYFQPCMRKYGEYLIY